MICYWHVDATTAVMTTEYHYQVSAAAEGADVGAHVALDINCSRAGSSMYLPPPCFNSCNKDSTGALEMGLARGEGVMRGCSR
ncbi:hypothetical protein HaLaN_09966 [Haematococcus lacustris]|uniref:Uncharacterized protein n=1 Tax=Haematococcus lacustris TaxID=44745 RepID=A0A699Z4Z9_HAELA|nr:hypothetical protein HaLaN_09966 [Haematococcus lacustris]